MRIPIYLDGIANIIDDDKSANWAATKLVVLFRFSYLSLGLADDSYLIENLTIGYFSFVFFYDKCTKTDTAFNCPHHYIILRY